MTARLQRIARSPFAADLRSGRFDLALGVLVGVTVTVLVAVVTRGEFLTWDGWRQVPTAVPA